MTKNSSAIPKKKIGIVLSGGGVRGIAHLGILKAFMNMGIEFSHISGTSAGSIAGSFYAAGIDPEEGLNIFIKTKLLRFIHSAVGTKGLQFKSITRLLIALLAL